jgi:hypothetical protein
MLKKYTAVWKEKKPQQLSSYMGRPTKDLPQPLFGSRVLIGFDVG